jgi:cell division protein FtsI (penicillin-binding protein 3)
MDIKKDILWRVYLTYFFVCFFAIAIVYQIFVVQVSQGEMWREKAEHISTKLMDIEAVRGNIYDANGVLLATSLPYYEIGIDLHVESISDEVFNDNVDSLAYNLSKTFSDKSEKEYKKLLIKARKDNNNRYQVLQRNVSYPQLQKVKKFPLLRRGRNRGGFVYIQINKRERLFQNLAARTIGKFNKEGTGKSYGLEIAYNNYLQGESGKRLMQKIAGGVWKPIDEDDEFMLEDGSDVISTIDINIQDVASNSLMNSLKKHGAEHGCLVLMEVKTGEIKAIANLTRKDSSKYVESFNYAIANATVPGSTFKLASMVAVIEDFGVELDEVVDVGDGICYYADAKVQDSHRPEKSKMTVQEIFEQSSNVGVTKIITRYYAKDPQKYIDRLYQMNLNSPLNLSIPGEAIPYIKTTKDKTWSKISLPWISYGYETRISPLQILTFYNAIANDGKMVKPLFAKEINKRGKSVKQFEPEIINPAICSKATIEKARKMMEGVVLNGTARSLRNANYTVAGKTGTAQIAKVNGKMTYQASFVGYFPADNPKYSCIVVVTAPTGDAYYGGIVAGPVFKEVADKVYSTSLEIHKEINSAQPVYAQKSPALKSGSKQKIEQVVKHLKIKSTSKVPEQEDWVASALYADSTGVRITAEKPEELLRRGLIPNIIGMSARDALFLLENSGIRVSFSGSGAVVQQSLPVGTPFTKGVEIKLQLI